MRGHQLGCRPSFQFFDALFHLLAGLECDDELFWDKYFFARTGVAGFPCGTPFYLKYAEIPEFDPLVLDQRIDDGIEGLLHDFLGLQLSQTDLFGNGLNNFFLRHDKVPYEKKDRCLVVGCRDHISEAALLSQV